MGAGFSYDLLFYVVSDFMTGFGYGIGLGLYSGLGTGLRSIFISGLYSDLDYVLVSD